MRSSAVGARALMILAVLAVGGASAVAQTKQPKPTVDLNCCYGQKPKCESNCPILGGEQRDLCLRDCEERVRVCLAQGVFDPRHHGENVMCFKRPGAG